MAMKPARAALARRRASGEAKLLFPASSTEIPPAEADPTNQLTNYPFAPSEALLSLVAGGWPFRANSIDSILTAIGMAQHIEVMIAAVIKSGEALDLGHVALACGRFVLENLLGQRRP
jgi:hypothetical protein